MTPGRRVIKHMKIIQKIQTLKVQVSILVEFERDLRGRVVRIKDLAMPTEDEMARIVLEQLPDDQKVKDAEVDMRNDGDGYEPWDDGECPAFNVDNIYRKSLEKWNKNWEQEMRGDFLCRVCNYRYDCNPHWKRNGKPIDVQGEDDGKKKEGKAKKQRTFSIALD